jgi:transketolase C-terminal domain/subunit
MLRVNAVLLLLPRNIKFMVGLEELLQKSLQKNAPVPVEFVGVRDSFGGSGEPEELMVKFGLTWKEIYASALVAMERRDKGSSGYRQVKDVEQFS